MYDRIRNEALDNHNVIFPVPDKAPWNKDKYIANRYTMVPYNMEKKKREFEEFLMKKYYNADL